MMEATARWTDNERFIGQATSGHPVVMDAAKDKTANSPMELVLIALCGCTAADVNGILRKKREPFTSLEVRAQAERATGYPAVYTEIKLTYRVGGKVSPRPWRMRFVCRKKNTVRSRRCWRKLRRLPLPSNTWKPKSF